jgi:hypothetical protein
MEAGIEVFRVRLPEGIKDANELLVKYGREKAAECFKSLLEKAQSFSQESIVPAK